MTPESSRPVRLASLALPARDRDIVVADLWEESAGQRRRERWVATETLRMAAHLHVACYRDARDAAHLLALLVCGAALLVIIRVIGLGPVEGAQYFTDAITRAIIAFWTTSNVTAALAAGLLVGRAPLEPHVSAARWHIVSVLAVMLVAQYGLGAGAAGATALVGAALLADGARNENETDQVGARASGARLPGDVTISAGDTL